MLDQPFDAVEKPEYVEMMQYAHHPAPTLKLSSRKTVKRRFMKMGKDTMDGIWQMFKEVYKILSNIANTN